MQALPDYKLEPPDNYPNIIGVCEGCKDLILEGEAYADDGKWMVHKHRDCLARLCADFMGMRREEIEW